MVRGIDGGQGQHRMKKRMAGYIKEPHTAIFTG